MKTRAPRGGDFATIIHGDGLVEFVELKEIGYPDTYVIPKECPDTGNPHRGSVFRLAHAISANDVRYADPKDARYAALYIETGEWADQRKSQSEKAKKRRRRA